MFIYLYLYLCIYAHIFLDSPACIYMHICILIFVSVRIVNRMFTFYHIPPTCLGSLETTRAHHEEPLLQSLDHWSEERPMVRRPATWHRVSYQLVQPYADCPLRGQTLLESSKGRLQRPTRSPHTNPNLISFQVQPTS